jgi:hypothetical protein
LTRKTATTENRVEEYGLEIKPRNGIGMWIHTCTHTDRHTNMHTYTHTYIHAYINTYTHTFTRAHQQSALHGGRTPHPLPSMDGPWWRQFSTAIKGWAHSVCIFCLYLGY